MRRFRLGDAVTASPRRRFRLPAARHTDSPLALPEAVPLPTLNRASEREPYVYRTSVEKAAQTPARSRTQKAAVETIRAPRMDTKPLATVSLRVASDLEMPGYFGSVTLRCSPESHDMRRVQLGVMPLLKQHNDDSPIGRVDSLTHVQESGGWAITGEASIADFPRAQEVLAEMGAGARRGVSPGFLVAEIELDDDLNMIIMKSEIYEVSIVTGAKNYGARVLTTMEASMTGMTGAQSNEIVHADDQIGLGVMAARVALRTGKGTKRQRRNLSLVLTTFDDAVASGKPREIAAALAKQAAGI